MDRYLSIPILGLAAALSAGVIPQLVSFAVAVLGNFTPALDNTRGQFSLVMLLVLAWSLRADLVSGLTWALVGGIFLDLYAILPLGTSSAALVIIVYVANSAARQLYRMRIITLLAMTCAATLFLQAFTFAALLLMGLSYDPVMALRLVLIPTVIFNLAGALPVYALVRIAQRRLGPRMQSISPGMTIEPESRTSQ